MYRALALSLIAFALPLSVGANVIVTEIMYDLPGTDTGREWIEVRNDGAVEVDISTFKLFEADTNHKLTAVLGGATLAPGAYAIIADNADKFLIDNAGYGGVLFDSAFSLSNTSETLVIRNGEVDEDSVTYATESGAAGDGQTLQLIDFVWKTGNPTPGSLNVSTSVPVEAVEEKISTVSEVEVPKAVATVATAPAMEVDELGIPLTMRVVAGPDRLVTVGAAEFFKAQAYRKTGVMEKNARYKWNFGNGFMRHGKELLFQYNYPGKYVALVTAEGPNDSKAFARVTVTAKEAKLAVTTANATGITVVNNDTRELNLSLWSIRSDDAYFLIPEDTILLPGSEVVFPSAATGLLPEEDSIVALVYPNGEDAVLYAKVQDLGTITSATQFVTRVTPQVITPVAQERAFEDVEDPVSFSQGDVDIKPGDLSASAGAVPVEDQMIPWLLGLSALLVAGLTGLFMIRNRVQTLGADDFSIIEIGPIQAPSLPVVIKEKDLP